MLSFVSLNVRDLGYVLGNPNFTRQNTYQLSLDVLQGIVISYSELWQGLKCLIGYESEAGRLASRMLFYETKHLIYIFNTF